MRPQTSPAPRKLVQLPVELIPDHSHLCLRGESRNLSKTGMLVLSEDARPAGTPVEFRFDEFSGRAEVVWRREDGEGTLLGLKFTEMPPGDRTTLKRILEDALPLM